MGRLDIPDPERDEDRPNQRYHYARINFPSEFVLNSDGIAAKVRTFEGREVADLVFFTLDEDREAGLNRLIRNVTDVMKTLEATVDDLVEYRDSGRTD